MLELGPARISAKEFQWLRWGEWEVALGLRGSGGAPRLRGQCASWNSDFCQAALFTIEGGLVVGPSTTVVSPAVVAPHADGVSVAPGRQTAVQIPILNSLL